MAAPLEYCRDAPDIQAPFLFSLQRFVVEREFRFFVERSRIDADASVVAGRAGGVRPSVDGERQDETFVIVSMLADEVYPSGCAKNAWLAGEAFAKFVDQTVNVHHTFHSTGRM